MRGKIFHLRKLWPVALKGVSFVFLFLGVAGLALAGTKQLAKAATYTTWQEYWCATELYAGVSPDYSSDSAQTSRWYRYQRRSLYLGALFGGGWTWPVVPDYVKKTNISLAGRNCYNNNNDFHYDPISGTPVNRAGYGGAANPFHSGSLKDTDQSNGAGEANTAFVTRWHVEGTINTP